MIRRNGKWISLLLAILMVIMTGCEAVIGSESINLNKVLQSNFDGKSMEGKMSLAMDFTLDDTVNLSETDQQIIGLLNHAKIDLYNLKVQDMMTESAEGDITVSKGKVHFKISTSKTGIVILVDGAAKPIVIDLASAATKLEGSTGAGGSLPIVGGDINSLIEPLQAQLPALLQAVGAYIIPNLPNPKTISIAPFVDVPINGESLKLTKVHAEIKGDEVIGLLKQFLTNLSSDDNGLKTLLDQLYEVLLPIIKDMLSKDTTTDNSIVMGYLNNKTLVTELLFTTLKKTLTDAVDSLNKQLDSSTSTITDVLGSKSYITADLYADTDLRIRKADFVVYVAPQVTDKSGVKDAKITLSSENWNVGKAVTVDAIDTTKGTLPIGSGFKAYEFMKSIDNTSVLYDVLKNDVHITRQNVSLSATGDKPTKQSGPRAFVDHDRTLVPVRFVIDQLEAKVDWDGSKQLVTVTDERSGATLLITIGSKIAYVNGIQKELDVPAALYNNSTYVPIRFITDNIGGDIKWDQPTHTIHITRE